MGRQFYDIDMQTSLSAGAHSVDTYAARAERLGFAGIAVTDYVEDMGDVAAIKEAVESTDTSITVRAGAKIRADTPEELKELLPDVREEVSVLAVHGGDVAVNKVAVADTRVDLLAHPELRRKDSGLDHKAVKAAAENKVAIGISLRQLLTTYGKVRAHILSHMRRNIRLAQEFGAPIVTTSSAQEADQLRAPRQLAAFPRILGTDLDKSFHTVSDTPHRILKRAEKAHSDEQVMPGVRKVEEDNDE